jgi:hypothetical protein
MLRFFGDSYREYLSRVTARYFTPGQAWVVALALGVYTAGFFYQ